MQNTLMVCVCDVHMGGFLGFKFPKQGSLFQQIFRKHGWVSDRKTVVKKGQGESECLFPEDLRSRERTYLVFEAQFGAERIHKTKGNLMSHCIKQ